MDHAQDARVGDLVMGRYRLEAVLDNTRDWAELWLGQDTALMRPVAVRLLDQNDPRTQATLAAARTAATVDDARCVRVLDVTDHEAEPQRVSRETSPKTPLEIPHEAPPGDDRAEFAYVVRSWVDGNTLGDVLVEGPLSPEESADLVADVADVVAAAHDLDLVHGVLDPQHVMLTQTGDVALLDLGIAGALHIDRVHGTLPDRTGDIRGLGALLYACLTSRWPADSPSVLDAATCDDATGKPLPPRRARAGVPNELDVLCRRALGERVGDQEPFDDARALAAALRRWLGRTGTSRSDLVERRAGVGRGIRSEAVMRTGNRVARGVVTTMIVALVVALGFVAVQVLDAVFGERDGSPPPGPTSEATDTDRVGARSMPR